MGSFKNAGKDTGFYKKTGSYLSGEMNKEVSDRFLDDTNHNIELSKDFKKIRRIWDSLDKAKEPADIDVEKALNKVKRRIQDFRKTRKFMFYLERIAAILFIPVLIASIVYYYSNKPIRVQQSAYNEIDNAYGTVSKLVLPDGTKVWLNSGSHFKYPLFFKQGVRKVFLSGEAYFEVAKNKRKPFVVNVSDIDVVATGTVFGVMAYANDENIVATLASGKISLAKETGPSQKLETIISVQPGQKAILNKEKKKITIEKADVDKEFAWKEGMLIFRDDPMDVVVRKLNRWYNMKIILLDKELETYRYTATFTDETLPQVLELLKHSAPLTYKYYPRKKKSDNSYSRAKVEISIHK